MTEFIPISEFRKNIKQYITKIINDKAKIVLQKHKRGVAIVLPIAHDSDDVDRCDHCGRPFEGAEE